MLQSGEYTKGEIAENRHIILLHRKINGTHNFRMYGQFIVHGDPLFFYI